jgi:hypothetical protein
MIDYRPRLSTIQPLPNKIGNYSQQIQELFVKRFFAACHARRSGTALSATIFLPMLLLRRRQKGFPLLSRADAST